MNKTVIGNWKMNGTREEGIALVGAIADFVVQQNMPEVEVVICPPTLLLSELSGFMDDGLHFGGQDCHAEKFGAFTGDISAAMLADSGARYVILGHSERRAGYGEASVQVAKKAQAAKAAGMIPVICIGETLAQREDKSFETVLAEQVAKSVPTDFAVKDYLLAYEPVWAIGTGKVADNATIEATHGFIAKQLPNGAAILYGGSVKAENAQEIMAIAHVDGVLVGGASLKAESFNAIIAAASEVMKKGQAA